MAVPEDFEPPRNGARAKAMVFCCRRYYLPDFKMGFRTFAVNYLGLFPHGAPALVGWLSSNRFADCLRALP